VSPLAVALAVAVAALMATWAPDITAMKNRLVDQIHRLLAAGQTPGVDDLELDPSMLAADLLHSMGTAAGDAAARVVEEAREQGVTVHPAHIPAGQMGDDAHAAAEQVTLRLRTVAARAVEQAPEDATLDDKVAAARAALDGYGDAGPAQLGGNAMHGAMTTARLETYRQGPLGAIYATEKNDDRVCPPCHEVDGRWLGNTDQMDQIQLSYPGGALGGYVYCQGGYNCRGTITGVWRPGTEEAPVEPGTKGHSLQGSIASGVASEQRLGGGMSADVDLVTFNDGARAIRKVARNTGLITPADAANAEQLSWLLASRAGIQVPEVLRGDRNTVWMAYVDDAQTGAARFAVGHGQTVTDNPAFIELADSDAGRRLGLFDVAIGNQDRNDGNFLVTSDGRLVGIDHGLSWADIDAGPLAMDIVTYKPFMRRMLHLAEDGTVTGSRDYSRADIEHLRQALAGMEQEFTRLRRHPWFVQAMARLAILEEYAQGEGSVF
jgi:tRNA A-37 threonylcarbamoyl transferase component Bud32